MTAFATNEGRAEESVKEPECIFQPPSPGRSRLRRIFSNVPFPFSSPGVCMARDFCDV